MHSLPMIFWKKAQNDFTVCKDPGSSDNPGSYYIFNLMFPFKNASAFLLRDARHAMHDILLLRISAILPEAISDGGLTPTTDTDLLLATCRGGSHFTSDIIFIFFDIQSV